MDSRQWFIKCCFCDSNQVCPQLLSNGQLRNHESGNECIGCRKTMRFCPSCKKMTRRNQFSSSQLRKGKGGRCKHCIVESKWFLKCYLCNRDRKCPSLRSNVNGNVCIFCDFIIRFCPSCKRMKRRNQFSSNQLKKGIASRCKSCVMAYKVAIDSNVLKSKEENSHNNLQYFKLVEDSTSQPNETRGLIHSFCSKQKTDQHGTNVVEKATLLRDKNRKIQNNKNHFNLSAIQEVSSHSLSHEYDSFDSKEFNFEDDLSSTKTQSTCDISMRTGIHDYCEAQESSHDGSINGAIEHLDLSKDNITFRTESKNIEELIGEENFPPDIITTRKETIKYIEFAENSLFLSNRDVRTCHDNHKQVTTDDLTEKLQTQNGRL